MKRRLLMGWTAAAVLLPTGVWAEPAELDQRAYRTAVAWFRSLFKPIAELAEDIDRIRLADRLTELGNSFESMVSDKREIAALLRRELDADALTRLKQAADKLKANVQVARQRMEAVAFPLKQAYREQGKFAAELLSEALVGGKAWLPELARKAGTSAGTPFSEDDRRRYAEEAEASARALGEAAGELSKLVDYVRAG